MYKTIKESNRIDITTPLMGNVINATITFDYRGEFVTGKVVYQKNTSDTTYLQIEKQ